jgi:hypothetical protein
MEQWVWKMDQHLEGETSGQGWEELTTVPLTIKQNLRKSATTYIKQ